MCSNASKENLDIPQLCDDTSCASVARSRESVNLNSIDVISDICSISAPAPIELESIDLDVRTITTSTLTTKGRNLPSAKNHVSAITQTTYATLETNTSNASSENFVHCNDEETSSTSHQMNADDDPMTKEKDVHFEENALKWFLSLPSGIDRAAAMATSDTSFIRTIVDLSSTKRARDAILKHHNAHSYGGNKCHNESLGKSNGTGKSMEAMPLDLVIQTFHKYLPSGRSFCKSSVHMDEPNIIRKESFISSPKSPKFIPNTNGRSNPSASPPISMHDSIQKIDQKDKDLNPENVKLMTSRIHNTESNNTSPGSATKSSTVNVPCNLSSANICNNEASEKRPSTMHLSSVKKVIDTSVVTTLHFQSGLSLPVSGTARTKEKVVRNNSAGNATRPLANKSTRPDRIKTDCLDEVHNQPSFHALNVLKNTTVGQSLDSAILKEKKQKALRAVLESKSAASRSLHSLSTIMSMSECDTFENAEEELLRSIRIIFSSALCIFQSTDVSNDEGGEFDSEVLTLDPEFLEKPGRDGTGLLFLTVVNNILRKELSKQTFPSRMHSGSFLFLGKTSYEPDRENLTAWPHWLQICLDSTNSSISIALLLLGMIEISIRNAHTQYLKQRNKHTEKKSRPDNSIVKNTEKEISSNAITINVQKNVLSLTDSNKFSGLKDKMACDKVIDVLPTIQFHKDHFDVTMNELPRLLKSWSRLHGQKSSSAANVRQLIRRLIAMGSSSQRQRGSMTAASSFHIDDLLLVSLPFFLLFGSSCESDISPNASLTNEQLRRWNGIIGQGKDYVVQALKKLDAEESSLEKSIIKEREKMEIEVATRDKDTTDKMNSTDNDINSLSPKELSNFTTENPKQSTSKKRKKNKKKKKRKGGNQSSTPSQSFADCKNVIEISDNITSANNGNTNDTLSDKQRDTFSEAQTIWNDSTNKEFEANNNVTSNNSTTEKPNAEIKTKGFLKMEQNNHSSGDSVASAVTAETSKSGESNDLPNLSACSSMKNSAIRSDIKMSLVNGVSGTCVVGGGRIEDKDETGNEMWETVEPKSGRGTGKKKNSATSSSGRNTMERQGFDALGPQSNTSNVTRSRNKGRTKQSRQRNTKVKMVKDVVNLILDNVDNEVSHRTQMVRGINYEDRRKLNEERRRVSNEQNKIKTSSYLAVSVGTNKNTKIASLRDVLVGKGTRMQSPLPTAIPTFVSSSNNSSKAAKLRSLSVQDRFKPIVPQSTSSTETKMKPSQQLSSRIRKDVGSVIPQKKTGSLASLDQNTAPTVPETLSGVSANTQSSCNTENGRRNIRAAALKDIETKFGDRTAVNGGNIVETQYTGKSNENIRSDEEDNPTVISDVGITNTPPPLSTLLGPGNENSASSSVDSSLDAPRASRYRSYCRGLPGKEDDVGYHLLDVCERLSDDMNSFMHKRSLALRVRRRERGALLTSLQETVQNIWSGQCRVETYGSCATQLDLPSSDLDVVICGLDDAEETNEASHGSNANTFKNRHKNSVSSEDEGFTVNGEFDSRNHESMRHHAPHAHPYYHPPSKNGIRVLQLASELERQPWAVQVKPIPTATVPVIKILADPSRLPGAATAEVDWALQHQHLTNHSSVHPSSSTANLSSSNTPKITSSEQHPIEATSVTKNTSQNNEHSTRPSSMAGLHSAQSSPFTGATKPWRGHDVMNGLLSVDITFEGPEHGGIGSTAFSASVVHEACNETGLPPDSTAVVQVVMVIKELLAQKRLNEPFSGGLSSYAIILLVVAVMKERRAIREEMERIERQRIAVESESSGVTCVSSAEGKNSDCDVNSSPLDDCHEGTVWSTSTTAQRASGKSKSTCSITQSTKNQTSSHRNEMNAEDDCVSLSKQESCAGSQTIKVDEMKHSKAVSLSSKSSWASIAMKKSVQKSCSSTQLSGMKSVCSASSVNSDSASSAQRLDLNFEKTNKKNFIENTLGEKKTNRSTSNTTRTTKVNHVTTDFTDEEMNSSSYNKEGVPHKNVIKSPLFPQGSNDVLEVLCSGETTAGKILMHFLLFYGQLFDALSTCVDVSGKHHPDYAACDDERHTKGFGHQHVSPFSPRKSGGGYDPVTGVFSVDPLVVYDPLEGAETNNVSRSCFAWSTIRWVFAQCYVTLSGVVERGAGLTSDRNRNEWSRQIGNSFSTLGTAQQSNDGSVQTPNASQQTDADGGLLELLISF